MSDFSTVEALNILVISVRHCSVVSSLLISLVLPVSVLNDGLAVRFDSVVNVSYLDRKVFDSSSERFHGVWFSSLGYLGHGLGYWLRSIEPVAVVCLKVCWVGLLLPRGKTWARFLAKLFWFGMTIIEQRGVVVHVVACPSESFNIHQTTL